MIVHKKGVLIELDIFQKSSISDVYSDKYTKININSDDDLPLDRSLNMQNVVILIKFVLIKNYNHFYDKMF